MCAKQIHWIEKAVLLVLVFTKPPYEVRETGWGEFEIQIKIYFQDSAEKPVSGGCGEVSECEVRWG